MGWGMDISQKYVFSDMYDITCFESREDMQFNAKKVISIALFLQKWDVFEHRRFSDYAVLFGTCLCCGIILYGLHKKLLKFVCLPWFFHNILVTMLVLKVDEFIAIFRCFCLKSIISKLACHLITTKSPFFTP